jgi:hypothetical protein
MEHPARFSERLGTEYADDLQRICAYIEKRKGGPTYDISLSRHDADILRVAYLEAISNVAYLKKQLEIIREATNPKQN